jgi:predicted DNA-binding ribbon-helix-helix protein
MYNRTILVHTGVMSNKTVRQSVSLPANVAAQVRNLARRRKLSSNRMLVELIENGIEGEKRKQQEFFRLAERFRNATNPAEAKRLGDELGRMVFGD